MLIADSHLFKLKNDFAHILLTMEAAEMRSLEHFRWNSPQTFGNYNRFSTKFWLSKLQGVARQFEKKVNGLRIWSKYDWNEREENSTKF